MIQRILCRHDFSHDMACLLMDDIRRAVEFLSAHPMPVTLSEGSGFHHN